MISAKYKIGIVVLIVAFALVFISYAALSSPSSSITSNPENSPITIRVETDKPSYALGEVVQIKAYFINKGKNAFKAGGLDMGYEILNSKGEVIFSVGGDYLFSYENPFTLPAQSENMFSYVFKWRQLSQIVQNSAIVTSSVTPGTYTVRFVVLAPIQATAETTVVIGG